MNSAGGEQDWVLEQQAAQRSRLSVLEQLHAEHEGFGAGSLAALKQSQHVLGSLADKIRVPEQFVTAIETALGHHLQLVLTEQPESAQQILAELNTGKKGRASVAPMAFLRNGHARPGESTGSGDDSAWLPAASAELNGKALDAISVVESEQGVRPLLQRLLGRTRIVRDLNAATAAWHDCGAEYHFVTLSGEVLSQHGVYTGGSTNGSGDGK